MLESAQNWRKKCTFGQFEDHNSGRKQGNFPFELFVTFIFVFENSQNSFSCGSPFGQFWSVKYLNLCQKLPIRTVYYPFLESRQAGLTQKSISVSFSFLCKLDVIN